MPPPSPTPADAKHIVREIFGEEMASSERFNTGAGNWVFDVTTHSGTRAVVRFMRSDAERAAGVYWSNLLRPRGVPLPKLIAHQELEPSRHDALGLPYMVLARFDGVDLGHVYGQLTPDQKLAVLDRVLAAQTIVHGLPEGRGFSYMNFPHEQGYSTWKRVIADDLDRSRQRIMAVGAVDPRHVDRVERLIPLFDHYFATIRPTPFLDDTTTRNVIVHNGVFQGIVDVDSICYGDPLLVPSLTRMALLHLGGDTLYTDAWLDRVGATPEQRRAVDFYTAVFAINFLGEQGQQFNRDSPPPVEPSHIAKLLQILDVLLRGLATPD